MPPEESLYYYFSGLVEVFFIIFPDYFSFDVPHYSKKILRSI